MDQELQKMGFGSLWRKWIQSCITSADMSIIINGSPSKPFHMQRGLHQGDPLSPFLFILVVEILNKLLKRAAKSGVIEGISVGSQNVCLTHLQFTDDAILFCPDCRDVLLNFRRILDCYGMILGLRINYEKSAIIPLNCDVSWVNRMKLELDCAVLSLPVKYFGIPLGANPKRVETWQPIISKIKKRLNGWKTNLLSKAGKLTLIKSVLTNPPIYYLRLFKMPKKSGEGDYSN